VRESLEMLFASAAALSMAALIPAPKLGAI
jgi:hypothetical protein